MMWVGWCIYGLNVDYGWLGIINVVLMIVLLLKFTGIPLSEQMALQTRGEDYQRYVSQTSPFIPWFKRKVNSSEN
jgi:steroid 5-alpha reductase family enzyme